MCHESSYQPCQQTCNTSRRSLQYEADEADVYDELCSNRRGSPRVWTLREVPTVLVAPCPSLENTAIHSGLSPHKPCQAPRASCPDRRGYFQQFDTRASGIESAELDKCTEHAKTLHSTIPITYAVMLYSLRVRVTLTAQRIQQLWTVFACYVHLSSSADSLPLALVSHC